MTPELERQIRDIIKDEFQKNYFNGDPKIPPHTHNGIDNLPINANDIVGLSETSPAGDNTQIQFNDNGAFGASDQLTFDKDTGTLIAPLINTNTINQVVDSFSPITIETIAPIPGNSTDLLLKTGDAETTGDLTEISGNIEITTGLGFGDAGDILIQAGNSVNGNDGQIDLTTNNGPINIYSQGGSGGGSGDVLLGTSAGVVVIQSGTQKIIIIQNWLYIQEGGVPGFTPGTGGILYTNAGALHYLGSSGTDTVIAPA